MSEIVDVRAFEVLDSRGTPTVMAEVTLDDDSVGSLQVETQSSGSGGQKEDEILRVCFVENLQHVSQLLENHH